MGIKVTVIEKDSRSEIAPRTGTEESISEVQYSRNLKSELM